MYRVKLRIKTDSKQFETEEVPTDVSEAQTVSSIHAIGKTDNKDVSKMVLFVDFCLL